MTIHAGFLGLGGIAQRELQTLSQAKDVKITGLCDLDAGRAAAAAQKFGGRAYTDFDQMLADERMEALFVALPPFAHSGQEEKAARQGIHLFLNKPVCHSMARAREIEAAIVKSGVVSSVGYLMRYSKTMDKARQLLAGRTIGLITGYTLVGLPGTPWWRVKQKSGGQMVEQSMHIFDLVRYLAGEAKEVYCSGARRLCTDIPGCDVEDVTVATLTLASGTIATMLSTCGLVSGGQFSIDVIAKGLRVQWDYGSERLVVHGPKGAEEFQERTDMFAEEIEGFLHAIRTEDRSRIRSTFSDAVKSLELSLLAEESMACGRAVKVAG